ncbi:MAG: hypothetical protein AAB601_00520 [Patescibacteria group bacterium]
MNMRFKPTALGFMVFVAAALCLVVFVPRTVSAKEEDRGGRDERSSCAKLDRLAKDAGREFTSRVKLIDDDWDERRGKVTRTREEVGTLRQERRAEMDAYRTAQFEALERQVMSDAEREAIRRFRAAITEAVRVHRHAFDRAASEFRAGVDEVIAAEHVRIEAAHAALKQEIDAAVMRAKIACNDSDDVSRVRGDLRTTVRSARDRFRTETGVTEGLERRIAELARMKQEALAEANHTLRTSLERARTDFARVSRP